MKSASIAVISLFSLAPIAQPLPDQPMPKPGRARSMNWSSGRAQMSVFPMSQRSKVQEEAIDYRPKCYGSQNCIGDLIFQINNTSGGQYEGKCIAVRIDPFSVYGDWKPCHTGQAFWESFRNQIGRLYIQRLSFG